VRHRCARVIVMQRVVLDVDMMCAGCANAVKRLATSIAGVSEVDVNVEAKKVVVRGVGLEPEDVRARIAKCGRATTLGEWK